MPEGNTGLSRDLAALLAGKNSAPVPGRPGWSFRLLTAAQVLQARREAAGLAGDDKERALCSNACLLARALVHRGRPVFSSGAEVLEKLRLEEIETLAGQWAGFNRAENPSPEDGEARVDALKKAWSTRLMSALSGACSKRSGCCRDRNRRGK